jgi:hypothetical protein
MSDAKSKPDTSHDGPVTITGTAENAKAGAVLVGDDGRTVYVAGMPEWPKDVYGKKLKLTGTLLRKKIFPTAEDAGAPGQQRMSGIPLVIELSRPYEKVHD